MSELFHLHIPCSFDTNYCQHNEANYGIYLIFIKGALIVELQNCHLNKVENNPGRKLTLSLAPSGQELAPHKRELAT